MLRKSARFTAGRPSRIRIKNHSLPRKWIQSAVVEFSKCIYSCSYAKVTNTVAGIQPRRKLPLLGRGARALSNSHTAQFFAQCTCMQLRHISRDYNK